MRALLLATLALAVFAPAAGAWTPAEDLHVARQRLPLDHPCRTHDVTIRPVPGLRGAAAAPLGHRQTPGIWTMATATGRAPLECVIEINPADWATFDRCQRRRAILHELAGHLAGHTHDEGGLMSESPADRDATPVPGCPGLPLTERVTRAILNQLPAGWEVTCGRRARIVRCRADHGTHVRRYRARQTGTTFTLRRTQ